MFNTGNGLTAADVAAVMGNNRSDGWGGFGGDGAWILIVLLALFGWGGNGFGGNRGGWGCGCSYGTGGGTFDGGIPNGFALATDFATLENKMDGINNGICDGFYATNSAFGNLNNTLATNFAAVQSALCQGFSGVNQAVVSQGYESRLGTQATQAQLAQCCCDIQTGIERSNTQSIMNTNAIQQQLSQCCCDQEKQAMQTRFDMAQNQCATLQAIDKVGDRIVDYLSQQETQRLRDENQALKFQASQVAQNQYLTDTLRPCPQPAYITCNPWGSNGTAYNSCGCNSGCCC